MLASVWVMTASATAGTPGGPVAEPPPREIVVTGERARRTLKETASSVAVLGRDAIEARPADRVDDLLAFIPNVQLGHGSEGPAIRGQDTTGALQGLPAFLGGNRPRTTIVVDGRAQTYNEFVFGAEPAWDVDRVEVFRSPQTTTQGQNSIAGAIFVYTADPTFEPEYRVRGIFGDFGTRQLSALASGPLGKEAAFRIAGDLRYARTTSRIVDRAAGADPNHDVYGLFRAKLLAVPGWLPGTELTLTYSHQQSQAPQTVQISPPFRKRRDASGFYGTFRINVDSLTARAHHRSGDVTADLVLTAGDSVSRRFAPRGFGEALNLGRDWRGEAIVNWDRAGPLRATAGLSHSRLRMKQSIDLSLRSMTGRFGDVQSGTGLFGEATLKVASRATLTAGVRYQSDRQERSGVLDAGASAIPLDYDKTFHAWLPKLSFAYEFSPGFTAGMLVEKAYNPGGTTLRFDTGQRDDFAAERLWDSELFARASLAGGRIAVSANAFYYRMRNAQRLKDIQLPGPGGFDVGFADLFNVPKARSYGAEAEIQWRKNSRFSATAGIGLLSTKVLDAGPDYPQLQGRSFDRSPHLSASASVNWIPVPRLNLSAQVRHHGPYSSDAAHRPMTGIKPATIADARVEYRFRRLSVFAYARNLFDSFALTTRTATAATAEDPREVGIGLDTRF